MTPQTQKRDRFKRLATQRTKNVLRTLKILGNCSNRNAYDYSEKEIEAIFSTIEKQLRAVKSRFQSHENATIDFKL